jgi:purine-nucleoside phosphorylase
LENKVKFGQLLSTDVFYKDIPDTLDWAKMGVIGVEMEAYALYLNAARAGKKALSICAVSDNIISHNGQLLQPYRCAAIKNAT